MKLSGKTIVITGASSGIGKALREYFSTDNTVISLSRSATVPDIACDLNSDISICAAAKQIIERYGKVDVLINNAGIAQQKMFCDITEQDFDRMMGVTVKGAFNCIQAALPDMVHEKSGKIINVSSMWGVCGASCEVHYSAAKSALIGLTKALARELAPSNIQVNCIAPGVIDTKMNASLGEETLELLKEESPMGRFGTPEEVARLMLFLAGDGSDFITGQTIGIDGAFI